MKVVKMAVRIAIGIALIVLGSLILSLDEGLMSILAIGFGLYILGVSLYNIFTNRQLKEFFKDAKSAKTLDLVKNIVGVVFGIFAIVSPLAFEATLISIVAYVAAAYLVFSAFVCLRVYFGAKGTTENKNLLIEGLLDIIISIFLFCAPQKIGEIIFKIIGIAVIVIGALYIASAVLSFIKASKKDRQEGEAEALN